MINSIIAQLVNDTLATGQSSDVFTSVLKIGGITAFCVLIIYLLSSQLFGKDPLTGLTNKQKTLIIIIVLVGIFGIVFLIVGNKTDAQPLKTVEFSGLIVDKETGNSLQDAYAYIILNKDTFYSEPRLTGLNGEFRIRKDTTIGEFSTFLYFGKEGYFFNNEHISSTGSKRYVLAKKIITVADTATFSLEGPGVDEQMIRNIERQSGIKAIPFHGKKKVRLGFNGSIKSEGGLFIYPGGSMTILVNGTTCVQLNHNLRAREGNSREGVTNGIRTEMKEYIINNHNLISQQISSCIQ